MTFENLFLSRWKLDLPVREEKERWPLFALRCFNYFSGSLITFASQFLRKFKKTKTNSILLILFQLLHLRDEQIAFTIKLRFNRINLNLVQRLYWHPSLHQSSLWTQKQRKLLLQDAPIMFLSIGWCHSGCKKWPRSPHLTHQWLLCGGVLTSSRALTEDTHGVWPSLPLHVEAVPVHQGGFATSATV